MNFKSEHEARKWFRKYEPFDDKDIEWFTYKQNAPKLRLGDWVLFQHIDSNHKQPLLSRPIFGVFAGWSVWDMALVMSFIESPRAFTNCTNIILTGTDGIDREWPMGLEDPKVESIPLWHDNVFVLGNWPHRPSVRQIKSALNKKLEPTPQPA